MSAEPPSAPATAASDVQRTPESVAGRDPVSAAHAAAQAVEHVQQRADDECLLLGRGTDEHSDTIKAATPQPLSFSSNGLESICMRAVSA